MTGCKFCVLSYPVLPDLVFICPYDGLIQEVILKEHNDTEGFLQC